jgi:5'-nucleotidase
MSHASRLLTTSLLALGLTIGLTACSDDDTGSSSDTTAGPDDTTDTTSATDDAAESTSTTGAAGQDTLHILVTNDDGIGAEGIDALTQALAALPDTEITIVAPAENQSGSSDTTSGGELVGQPATTSSGMEGTAVDGTPADSVIWALDQGGLASLGIEEPPDLVISGINEGQNIGPFAPLSGTVGAARTASREDIPSLAASQGLIQDEGGAAILDYESGVEAVLTWLEEHRDDLVAGSVTKIDIPTCPTGSLRGTEEVPLWVEGDEALDPFAVDCASTLEDPADDVTAFVNGFVAITVMPVDEWDAALGAP